jgi:hypothetical protein
MTMDWYPIPEEAAKHDMPAGITHVIATRYTPGGEMAYVLLAIEANPTGVGCPEVASALSESTCGRVSAFARHRRQTPAGAVIAS